MSTVGSINTGYCVSEWKDLLMDKAHRTLVHVGLLVILGAGLSDGLAATQVPVPTETVTNATILIGEAQGNPLMGEELEKVTYDVASRLRCPVCQGLSVADSHTDTAVSMMNEVRELLAAGFTQEQSLLFFEKSYGEFIRLEPKAEGFNLMVWIVPVVALLLGLGVIAARLRGAGGHSTSNASSDEAEDPELAEFLAQVRRDITAGEQNDEPDDDEDEG